MPSRFEKYMTHHTSRRTDGWDYTQPAAYFVTICVQNRVCLFGQVERGQMWLNDLGKIVAEEWKRSQEIRDRVHLDAFVVMPNHLHGIVVFADPEVDAPTCPRGYRAFETDASRWASTETIDAPASASPGQSDDSPVESGSGDASHGGGMAGPTDGAHPEKASTGGSTLLNETRDVRDEKSDSDGESDDDRPTGPAPKSLGSFVAGFKSAATKRINAHRDPPGTPVWQRNYHDVIIKDERHWRNARAYICRNPADWGGDRLHRDREYNA